jgi:hypothetical protein
MKAFVMPVSIVRDDPWRNNPRPGDARLAVPRIGMFVRGSRHVRVAPPHAACGMSGRLGSHPVRPIRQTQGMTDGLPDRPLLPDDKSGWYAFPLRGYVPAEEEAWVAPAEGSTIRLMGEYMVEVPLWCDGLLFGGREELRDHFGVSEGLAKDIVAWAAAWQDRSHGADLDREAARLVARLNHEVGHRYSFTYQP